MVTLIAREVNTYFFDPRAKAPLKAATAGLNSCHLPAICANKWCTAGSVALCSGHYRPCQHLEWNYWQ
jgi:hypothetical protein